MVAILYHKPFTIIEIDTSVDADLNYDIRLVRWCVVHTYKTSLISYTTKSSGEEGHVACMVKRRSPCW